MRSHSLSTLAVLAALTLASSASATLVAPYANAAAFQATLQTGSYLETFSGLTAGRLPTTIDFASGSYGYTVSSAAFMWSGTGNAGSAFLGAASTTASSLTFTFTGGNPTAIGANFFNTDVNDSFVAGNVTLTLNDGTIHSFASTATGGLFIGFHTDSAHPITSLTVDNAANSAYITLDNLVVGSAVANAVPESSTYGLAAALVLGFAVWRRRK